MAFVLGGGGSSAAGQVGMLKAVAEFGIEPDLIVGTSAGALNGALLADDPSNGIRRLEEFWVSSDRRHVVSRSRFHLLRNLAGRRYMYKNDRLSQIFAQHIEARRIEELKVRFACVATDLRNSGPAVLGSGPLLSALLATCAIPGVFPVVERDGMLLADGLCVANVPIREAVDAGAASVIVFDSRPGIPPVDHRDVRDSVFAAFTAALTHQKRRDLEYARNRVEVLDLPGRPARHVKAFDFDRSRHLIDDAYVATGTHLGEWTRNQEAALGRTSPSV